MVPQDGPGFKIKLYVVLQRNNVARQNEPNEKIIHVSLTHKGAQDVVDQIPGTRIEKHRASK